VSEAAFKDPALAAEPGAVSCPAARDDGCDAQRSQEPAVLVLVIAAVSEHAVLFSVNMPDIESMNGSLTPVSVLKG